MGTIRLIRSTNSGEVTVFDDAVVFHNAKGHDYTGDKRGGVFEKVYNQFNAYIDHKQDKLIIESGMGMLYGRQFELAENETIEISLNGNDYIVVYVELTINRGSDGYDEESIAIKAQYGSSSYPSIGNTDLVRNRYGSATMELYRVSPKIFGLVRTKNDRRYVYKPGYAEKARMMDANGVINGRKVGNLVFPDKDMVKHTDHAYYADRVSALGDTGVGATRNAINDDLYMKNRDSYLVTAREFCLKGDTSTWGKNTTHEVELTIPSGHVIGAMLYGSAARYNDMPFIVGDPTQFPFTISRAVTNKATVEVTVNKTKATIKLGDTSIDGQLYLTLLMLGSV